MDAFVNRMSNTEARLNREHQRRRLGEEKDETAAPAQPVPSHRGVGSLPLPSAPPKGAFTAALAKRTTPPSSVVLAASDGNGSVSIASEAGRKLA